jgi:sugar transferase (PEP-CTERM system associated)
MQRVTWRLPTLALLESGLIVGGISLAVFICVGAGVWEAGDHALVKALLIAGVCQVCLYFADLYDLRIVTDRRELFVRLLQALGATSVILALLYLWFPGLVIGRGVFVVASAFLVSLIVGWRLIFDWITRRLGMRERLLLVGTSAAGVMLARELHERQDLGVAIVGFIDADPARVGTPVLNPGVIGTIEDIPAIARARSVDRVVVNLADSRGKLPMEKLLEMKLEGVQFDPLASVYEEYTGKIAVENLRPSWLIFSPGFRKGRLLRAVKLVIDLSVGTLGLVLAAPVMLLIGLAVKMTSDGPALYSQTRVGQHGRVFIIHKFRSMRRDAESSATGAVWARPNDDRVTTVGRFLRRTRLDELPQLWNVLRCDMSLVGPRPERPEFVCDLAQQIPFYGQRHIVKPGLTGWAQVRYTYAASVEDAMEKLQYDLFYIKNLSIALDVYIILKTIKTVLLQRGAQ